MRRLADVTLSREGERNHCAKA